MGDPTADFDPATDFEAEAPPKSQFDPAKDFEPIAFDPAVDFTPEAAPALPAQTVPPGSVVTLQAPGSVVVPPAAKVSEQGAQNIPESGFLPSLGASIESNIGNAITSLVDTHVPTADDRAALLQKQIDDQEAGVKVLQDALDNGQGVRSMIEPMLAEKKRALEGMKAQLDARTKPGGDLNPSTNPDVEASIQEINAAGEARGAKLRKFYGPDTWKYYGADPRSTNWQAQAGRGAGTVIGAVVPTMFAGPAALPLTVLQMTGGAAEQARQQKEDELRQSGITDPEVIRAEGVAAANEAAKNALPGLGLYMLSGKVFGALAAGAAERAGFGTAAKVLSGLAGATVSNVGVGSVLRALEAPEGHRLEAALPKIENLTADTLFAVMHAHGVYSEASTAARARAAAELQRRGATDEDLSAPAPEGGDAPAQEIIPTTPAQAEAPAQAETPAAEAAPAEPVTPEAQEMHAQADQAEANNAPKTAEALRQKAAATDAAARPPQEAPPSEEVVDELHRPEVQLFNEVDSHQAVPETEPPAPQQEEFPIDAASRAPAPTEPPAQDAEPAASEPAAVPEPASDTQISGLAVREVPLDQITLSTDVPQFKHGADSEGVVEPLQGKFDRTGVGPVQLWERLDGRLELISGRHRRKLAIDSGETTIPAQIHREADGFDLDAASTLDAELNIRDGQGSTSDYASYFRLSGLPEADASSRGLLARAKGRAGFRIATGASEDVFALHQQGRLSDAQAEALSTAAPGNDAAQRIGLRAIFGGASIADARNTVEAALAESRDLPHAEQGDFFANTALDDQWQRQAKVASQHQRDLREQISAVQGAAKKPEVAARLGVDVKDPAGVQKRVAELRAELARWEKWSGHPDLVAITRGEKPAEKPSTPLPTLRRGEKQGDLLSTQTEDLALVGQEQKGKTAKPFGQAIQAIIDDQPAEHRFGDSKVWLKPVFEQALREGLVSSRADFDAKMVAALRNGEVAMSRADFPPHISLAGDEQKAAQALHDQSALQYGNEVFHFARRSEDQNQGALFSKAEDDFLSNLRRAASKAPHEADLTTAPGTIEFQRPGSAATMRVLNTKEAIGALIDRYRAPSDSSHLQRIGTTLEPMIRGTKGVSVRILRNEGDVPARVRSQMKPGERYEGFVDVNTGDVYIFADNISSPDRAMQVFAHEVVGHYGVEKIVDPKAWGAIAKAVPPDVADRIGRLYVRDEQGDPIPREQWTDDDWGTVAREYVARLAENPSENPGLWRRVVQAVRNGLRRMNIVKEWSEEDIRDLIRRGAKAVREKRGVRMAGDGGEFRASVRDLGKEVEDRSPYASHIEAAFERVVPDEESRDRISRYVEARLGGSELPHTSANERNLGERFITYFRNKAEFAKRNGVAGAAQDAYETRLRANPRLTLPERVAVYSSEVNRLVTERTNMRGPGTGGTGEKSVSATKNALVDERRQKYGLPPAMEPARHAFGAAWDEAMRMIDTAGQDANPGRDLVDSLEKKARPINDTENALLLHRQVTLQNEYEQAARAEIESRDRGDDAAAETARIQTASLSDELQRIYDVGKKVGTELGRGLNIRKMLAKEDYSLAKMQMKSRAAKGGRPLTPEEAADLNRMHQQIELFTKAADEAEAKAEETAATNQAKDALKEVVKQHGQSRAKKAPPAAPEAKPATEATKGWLQRQAEAAKERIRQRGPRAMAGIDPLDAADRVIVAADWIASGLRDFAGYAARVVREWGQEYTPHLKDIWDRANALIDNHEKVATFAAKARQRVEEGATLRQLRPYIQKVAEGIVRRGTVDLEPLLDQLHPFVEEIIPGTTRRQTMDIFSGYGEFRPLDKDAIKVQLRDLRGQAQQTGKILDMQSGQPPKKTGPERRTPSDKERPLIKEVNRLKKEGNFTVTDPETQLRTAKQAIKTRLRNAIVDMAIYMDTGERPADGKKAVEYDQEMDALKQIRDQMKATLDAIEPKPGMTDEQIDKATIRALQNSMDEYDRRFSENDYLPKQKKGGRYGPFPVIDMMRAHRNAMRDEFLELRELDDAWQQQKAEKRQQDLLNQIAEIDSKLEAGKYDAEQRGKKEATPENQALRDHRDELQKQFAREQRAANTPLLTEEQKDAKRNERLLRSYKTRLAQREYDLQASTAFGDFAPRTRRPIVLDDEALQAKANVQRAKNEFERSLIAARLAQRGTFERTLDGASKWRRAFVLSGFHTLFKLASSATEIIALSPVEEAVGGALGHVPGLRRVSEQAPRHGGFNLDAEIKAITETGRNLAKDAWDYMSKGGTDMDEVYGQAHLYPFEWKEMLGRIHGALKTPARRNEWTRSYAKRLAWEDRQGNDISDPLVQTRAATAAYVDANKSIFTESNMVVDAYKRALSRFSQPDKETGNPTVAGKVAETTARVLLPVVRIPTNIVARVFEYTCGSVTGSVRLGLALRRGIDNLPPEHADLIMSNLKRGSLGLAVLTLGFLNPQAVGGYYTGKRKDSDVDVGGLRIFGVNIPKVLVHHPLLEAAQVGATIRRVMNSRLRPHDAERQGFGAATLTAILGLVKQVPFVDLMGRTGDAIKNAEGVEKWADKMVESLVVPVGLREAAQLTDHDSAGHPTKRKPDGMWETLKTGVPGARQTVHRAKK